MFLAVVNRFLINDFTSISLGMKRWRSSVSNTKRLFVFFSFGQFHTITRFFSNPESAELQNEFVGVTGVTSLLEHVTNVIVMGVYLSGCFLTSFQQFHTEPVKFNTWRNYIMTPPQKLFNHICMLVNYQ